MDKRTFQLKILYYFLIYMLFVNTITNKVSIIFTYSAIVFFIILIMSFGTLQKVHKGNLIYALLMAFCLVISFSYQQLLYENNNLYSIQFFGAQVFFFFLFSFCIDIENFFRKYYENYLILVICLISLFVIIDSLLLFLDLEKYQLMYREHVFSYRDKPLGLFGQFSVTSTYIVFFILLYFALEKKITSSLSLVLMSLVTIVIVLQNSGTGYIVYMGLIYAIFHRINFFKIILIPLIISVNCLIILSGSITKISMEYIAYLVNEYVLVLINKYFEQLNSPLDLLFGKGEDDIDFGLTFFIGNIGLLYFILYSMVLFYMIWKNKNIYYRMAMVSLMFGNLHYPVLFYPLMNVFMPLLLLITLHKNSPKKTV